MSPKDIAVAALVGLAALVAILSLIGLFLGKDPADKLHFVTPISTFSAPLLLVGLIVKESFDVRTLYVLVLVVVLLVAQPLLNHVTVRGLRAHLHEDWRVRPEERMR